VKFKEVDPNAVVASTKRVVEIQVREYTVIDSETGERVGIIDAPLDFCPFLGCEHSVGSKHPAGFIRINGLQVHHDCGRPTRRWWDATFKDLVKVDNGVKLPWENSETANSASNDATS